MNFLIGVRKTSRRPRKVDFTGHQTISRCSAVNDAEISKVIFERLRELMAKATYLTAQLRESCLTARRGLEADG